MASNLDIARIDLCDSVLAERERAGCDRRWLWQIRRRVLRYERTLIDSDACRGDDARRVSEVLTQAEREHILETDPMLRYDHRTHRTGGANDAEASARWRRQFVVYLESLADSAPGG